MEKPKRKKLIITLSVIFAIIIAIFISVAIYLGNYYHASDNAKDCVSLNNENYTVETKDENIFFVPKNVKAGLIFYPGGKVEHTSYAPLMTKLANEGVLCVIVKMPFNLAVFNKNAANGIKELYPEVKNWYIGGHSLGGAMAASYVSEHTSDFCGLLLLGAYSTADISDSEIKVLSVYGSEDKVMNHEKYEECKKNLPNNYKETVIEGGCHAYFGDYGAQKGDGTPKITREEQQNKTAEAFLNLIGK